jgi:dTDP-4-dehydrorhamnose reductase
MRLAGNREVAVVDDQRGCPTSALDLAGGVLAVCAALHERRGESALRGLFHLAGAGEASWADLAEAVFAACRKAGAPAARLRRIASADYPAQAPRPANSRLDCAKLATVYGIALPTWRESVAACVARLLREGGEQG